MEELGLTYASAIINDEIKIPKANLTKENLENILNELTAEMEINNDISEEILTIALAVTIIFIFGLLVAVAWMRTKKEK